jgi:transcriptional regulator with XRE-family HTH domain
MAETTTTDTPTIGVVIRAWRLYRGLTTKALAEKAGVRGGYLSEIEHDKKKNPWLGQLEKLVEALEISLEDIHDRRLPPGQEAQVSAPPIHGTGQASQPPATTVVEELVELKEVVGSVLEQILGQMGALTTAVSQLQADVSALKQSALVPAPTTRIRRTSTHRVRHAIRIDDITGQWEGSEKFRFPQETVLTFPPRGGNRMVVPHNTTVVMTLRLRLERAFEARLSGGGTLLLALWVGELTREEAQYDLTVVRGLVEHDKIRIHLLEPGQEIPQLSLTATLSDDGRILWVEYEVLGVLTEREVTGIFSLERVRDPAGAAIERREESR